MPPFADVFRWDDLEPDHVTEMVTRKVLRTPEHEMALVHLMRGALVPRHVHAAEQILHVQAGALRVRIHGDERVVRAGEILAVPANAPHQAEALDDTAVLVLI